MGVRMNACPNGHLYTPENTVIRRHHARNKESRQCVACKAARMEAQKKERQQKRARENAMRASVGLHPISKGVPAHGKLIRWTTKSWVGADGRLYATAEANEYERANEDLFRLNARRALVKALKEQGLPVPERSRGDWWEPTGHVRKDWATLLPMDYTVRTTEPIADASKAA